jgi:hypothetical protein
LKLPVCTPTSDPWTPEQTQALGDATKVTKAVSLHCLEVACCLTFPC